MKDNYCGEMTLRYLKTNYSQAPKIHRSTDIINYLKSILDPDELNTYEVSYMLCLARDNSLLGFSKLSQGGRSSTIIDPIILFTTALLKGASSLILCHNHPSGQLQPSQADKDITYKIKEGGKILDIQLIDHLIINSEFNYYSFADEGAL